MQDTFKASELIHIWKCQPCESGDTLSGGETVANLRRLGLIESTAAGYVTTSKGATVVQKLIEHLDKLQISLTVGIAIHSPMQAYSNQP